jgi:electron transport complex protein RnfB
MPEGLAERIDALLPQTQCTRCSYPDCRHYAEAIAAGEAGINQCPPGGESTLLALAALTQRLPQPIDPARGTMPQQPEVALIEEADCIGCYKCVQVCPTDAILGAPKLMHTVIAMDCSGCELCLPVCPTDCITMTPRSAALPMPVALAPRWRTRYGKHGERRAREQKVREDKRRSRSEGSAVTQTETGLKERAASFDINAAIARARSRDTNKP